MAYKIALTDGAILDLLDINRYIAQHDSKADHVLSRLEETIGNVAELPERGVFPQELSTLGIREFREIFFKPYRIIFRVIGKTVYVYLIADGRRDMQTLLKRRLLHM